jgi:hypothetical protein
MSARTRVCRWSAAFLLRRLKAWDFGCHEVGAYLHVSPGAACVGGDEDIDCGTVGGWGDAGDSCWDVGDRPFKPVVRDLLVPGCLKPVREAMVTHDKRRHSEIGVQGLAVQAGTKFPSGGKCCHHESADNAYSLVRGLRAPAMSARAT